MKTNLAKMIEPNCKNANCECMWQKHLQLNKNKEQKNVKQQEQPWIHCHRQYTQDLCCKLCKINDVLIERNQTKKQTKKQRIIISQT